jgi:succinyl-CoA synthetase beta subunit
MFQHAKFLEEANTTDLDSAIVRVLYALFVATHMTYLEINPALITAGSLMPLDAAVEVDSAAVFFVKGAWSEDDAREAGKKTESEIAIERLNSKSPASFNLKILNKDAGIFLLLSGGGASVVVADEFAAQGLYANIANYGEYSGNPNSEETYEYTKQLLRVLIDSRATKKVLMIGGGTANFTDISKTFNGVIKALSEVSKELHDQDVGVYVRRGGPNHREGLRAMSEFLLAAKLKFMVCGPEKPIAQLVRDIAEVMHV